MTRIWTGVLLASAALCQETFHLTGTAVNTLTGQPVKGALITVIGQGSLEGKTFNPPGPDRQRELLTDAAGRFSADGLPPGPFSIRALKPGFTWDSQASTANVTLGPSRDGLTISFAPLAIISGKVTDDDGEPVPFASVRAIARETRDGTRYFRQVRSVSTDDQGRYRMWNFTPGEYYIATAGRTGGTVAVVATLSAGTGGPDAFAPVYYPAAHDRDSATPIVLGPGQEFTADLRVRMEPSFRIRGALRGIAANQPVQLELLRAGNDLNATRAMVNSATGRFEAREAVPGAYLLRATQGTGKQQVRGETQIQVAKADITGVVLDLVPGVTITGVVRMPALPDGELQNFRGPRRTASVSLTPVDSRTPGADPSEVTDSAGRFSIQGVWPGRYRVHVQPLWGYAAAAVSGTQDLLHGELLVDRGAPPAPILVDVRNDSSSVSVETTGSTGWILLQPMDGGDVQYLPVHPELQFKTLAPGHYRLLWVKAIEGLEFRNPAVLTALRGGETVQLTAGATSKVTIKEVAQ